eukprot:TRINITY_DN13659_c1_g1_i1.p1 TRINITY_DN13659_c1_g1~~TRINITY_DN13659_c1_g1_i1.p1  ORF type:complete len:402 (+),score=90.38 TRINITY_DN13659_c1_g1_i1:231-1436(+)
MVSTRFASVAASAVGSALVAGTLTWPAAVVVPEPTELRIPADAAWPGDATTLEALLALPEHLLRQSEGWLGPVLASLFLDLLIRALFALRRIIQARRRGTGPLEGELCDIAAASGSDADRSPGEKFATVLTQEVQTSETMVSKADAQKELEEAVTAERQKAFMEGADAERQQTKVQLAQAEIQLGQLRQRTADMSAERQRWLQQIEQQGERMRRLVAELERKDAQVQESQASWRRAVRDRQHAESLLEEARSELQMCGKQWPPTKYSSSSDDHGGWSSTELAEEEGENDDDCSYSAPASAAASPLRFAPALQEDVPSPKLRPSGRHGVPRLPMALGARPHLASMDACASEASTSAPSTERPPATPAASLAATSGRSHGGEHSREIRRLSAFDFRTAGGPAA